MNVQQYLNDCQVPYDVIPHREVFDAQHLAQILHVHGQEVAKTVLLRADHGFRFVVVVLPASKRVDFQQVSQALGGANLQLATEFDVARHCPDCEFGVLPPFGSQYGLKTLVDRSLTNEEQIVFEGNTHHDAIRMRFVDYRRIEQPMLADVAV